MRLYHGTTATNAVTIRINGADVTRGGGELGRGFYLTEQLPVAMAYAKGRHGLSGDVVCFDVTDGSYATLNVLSISMVQMQVTWYWLKITGRTGSYLYGVDVVFGPLAFHPYRTQHKFESTRGQSVLNASPRSIL